MPRFLQLLLALGALGAGLWCFYAGYARDVSLAGRTEKGLAYLRTGLDGKARVLTAHQLYGLGTVLLIGSLWWLARGDPSVKPRRR